MMPSSFLLFLLFHLVVICPFSARAQTYKNISQGTVLTPLGPSTSCPSPSAEFAFGFIPLPADTTLFLLAIWFAKTINKTIVWTANGNTPVLASSKLQLTTDGKLLLTDPSGKTVWSPNTSGLSHAAVLDTGNLVLISSNSGDITWQSFDNPTDTILPTQVLGLNAQLQSRITSTNYSSGRFLFTAKFDSDLQLCPISIPTSGKYQSYWSTGTEGSGSQLVFNSSGIVYFEVTNGTQIKITSASIGSSPDFYQMATLDADGVFKHFVYPKNMNKNGSWEEQWNIVGHVPQDICTAITNDNGSGACGFNSYCQLDQDQMPFCQCPYGYSFIDPVNKYRGCMPDFATQRCDVDDSARFELREMQAVDWPLSDYEDFTDITEDQCREYCQHDCFCAAAIYGINHCWKKKMPLSNGRSGVVSRIALIKVAQNGSSGNQPPDTQPMVAKKDRKALIIIGSSLLGGSVLLNFVFITATLVVIFCYSVGKNKQNIQQEADISGFSLRNFTYKELHLATNGFNEEVGRGSFGTVYKGSLMIGPGICVAVKKLDKVSAEAEKEFMAEVRSIGQTHHRNLVRLLGFCNEEENRLLVYEFMSNGSLTSFLFGDARPVWNKRVPIILGIARGLSYLHEDCMTSIIHCDIKTQNILLDGNFSARISDFGLAKLLRADQTRTNTGIRGTKGYVAPEWFKSMPITTKVDVYSFGVLLLEIICCRKNFEQDMRNEEEVLVFWAYDCYQAGRLDLLVASDDEAIVDMKVVERFTMVAIWCIQEDPSLRPTMRKVNQMLDGSVPVSVPPDPSSFISSIQ